jgi:hypothetical protein
LTLPNGAAVEVATIPFHGGDVLAALIGGREHIVLRPAVERLGINYSNQLRKLKAKSWACVVNLTMQLPGDSQTREHAAVDIRTFLMLLATINENQVGDDVRGILVAFQSEIADVIEAYFTDGQAVNPRLAEQSHPVQIAAQSEIDRAHVARAQIEMLGVAVSTGLLDKLWATSKTHVIAARTIGEEPELPESLLPLYVPDFLKSKGLNAKDVNSVQSWFGRRAVEIGEANELNVPALRPTEQPNGSIRETRAWRQEHLPLFEEVWNTYYAEKYARPMFLELGAA